MDHSKDISAILRSLTMHDIRNTLPEHTFGRVQKRSRAKMEEAIFLFPDKQLAILAETACSKRRKIEEDCPLDDVIHIPTSSLPTHDHFFFTIPEECRQDCLTKFIDATGRAATVTSSCAVCAGNFFTKDINQVEVSFLWQKKKLIPSSIHPAHVLTDGMLLDRSPLSLYRNEHGILFANVCDPCVSALKHDKTPSLSLANGMWVGDVPLELQILTLPERILIARHFPAAYIIKLYPKKKGARSWPSANMQSGLRGNVSTYRLNTNDIAQMTHAQLMLPSSSILAATIGVTFVGPGNLPEKTMPGFL